MRDLSMLADQIRNVRTAQRRFVHLWRMEMLVSPTVLDRLAADMAAAHRELEGDGTDAGGETMLKTIDAADATPTDWQDSFDGDGEFPNGDELTADGPLDGILRGQSTSADKLSGTVSPEESRLLSGDWTTSRFQSMFGDGSVDEAA